MNKISDYAMVLVGAYIVIASQAFGGGTVKWWHPLGWIVIWTLIEIPVRMVRRHRNRRRNLKRDVA